MHIFLYLTWLSKQLSLHPLSCIYSYDKPMGELRHGQTTVVPNYTVAMVPTMEVALFILEWSTSLACYHKRSCVGRPESDK